MVTTRGREAAAKTTGLVDRGREAIHHQRDQLSAALEAGKQAYKEEKDKANI
jgi:hypothetical protein